MAHLAAITSEAEHNFIGSVLPTGVIAWVGLDDSLGTYQWVNGEPFTYGSNLGQFNPGFCFASEGGFWIFGNCLQHYSGVFEND